MDATRSKRAILALGVLVVALSAIIIEFRPTFPLVLIGLTLQGVTGGIFGPAIAAISLGLVGHMALPERLGRNQRFAATGSLAAAALMGLTGYIFSYQAIFLLVVVLTLPVFVSLARIHATDIHLCGAPSHHALEQPTRAGRTSLWKSPGLLVLALCLFLFQLGNASMLPLTGESLIYQGEGRSSLIVSALIVLPQIVVAALAPWVGREANNLGARKFNGKKAPMERSVPCGSIADRTRRARHFKKSRILSAISRACVSNAKWPVSKKRTTAFGMSRLNASAPGGRKNGSFLPHAARSGGLCVRK
jgi:MFS family permease